MLYLIFYALFVALVYGQFTLVNTGVNLNSYLTLTPAVTYDLNFTLSKTITAGSSVILSFSSDFVIPSSSLTNCMASTLTTTSPSSSACSSVYSSGLNQYSVTYPNIYLTGGIQTFLRLKFNINNPWGETSSRIDVYINDINSQTLQSTTFFISFSASSMTGCSYTGFTSITGQNTTHTITFTPSRDLIGGSYLVITMPFWFIGSSSNTSSSGSSSLICTGIILLIKIQNTSSSNLTCSLTNSSSSNQLLTINDFVAMNQSLSGMVQVQVASLRNPWSLYPFGPIKFQIYYQNLIVSQRCLSVYETATQAANFKGIIFSIPTLTISTLNSAISIFLTVNNPCPKNKTLIKIEYSSQINISYSGAFSILSQNSTQMILTNVLVSSDKISGSITTSAFTVTTPPSTRSFTFTFTTLYIVSGVYYDIDTISKTFQNTAGAITSVTITPNDTSINVLTSYTITFTLTNKLINNSSIQIVFPIQLTVDSTAICSSNISISSSCTVNSNNLTILINGAGSLTGLSSIIVTIDKVKNSPQSVQTTTFKIYTYYDNLYDSIVDKVDTGITVTITPNPIIVASVEPANLTTYAVTSYTFGFTIKDPIPLNGYIQIVFPVAVLPLLGSVALTAASFSTNTCTLSLNGGTLRILNCFLSAGIGVGSVEVTVGGVRNPQSFKPTDTFQIFTYSGLPSLTNYINSSLTVTMNSSYQLTTFSITPQSSIVHTDTNQTLNIMHEIPLSLGDYLLVGFDSTMMISNTLSCSPLSGVATITCVRINSTELKITYTTLPSSQTISLTISTVTNYDIAQTPIIITSVLYTSDNYIKQQATTTVTYVQSAISTFSVSNDDSIILYDYSNITVTLSSPFTIGSLFDPTKTMLEVILPAGMATASNTACIVSTGTCSIPTNTTFQVVPVGLGFTSLSIVMTNILLPYIATQSGSFSITFYYNSKEVATVTSGVAIQPYCTSPCKACNVTKTKCLSCLPNPNTLIFYNPITQSCLIACPIGMFPDTLNTCQSCVSPCLTCIDAVSCLSCINNTWLSGQSCVNPCPDQFYNGSNGVCQACVSPCVKCKSQTQCLSCSTGFYYNYSCLTANSCPSGTYANTSTLNCENCTTPCATCSNSASNCTSCIAPNLYYSGNCATSCPAGMYPSGANCLNCTSPCSTCFNSSYCLSCTSNFYFNGSCVIDTSCPVGTFPNLLTLSCSNCTSPCATCSNISTNCTSCISSNFYYNGNCVSSCPSGMYRSGSDCLNCTGACGTCLNASYCLTCTSNYVYNGSCVLSSSCPSGTYPDSVQMKCETCPVGCTACVSSTNCTSCNTPTYIFYSNSCITSCPDGTYKSGSSCLSCSSTCSNCQNTSTSCISCPPGTYLYNKSCLSSCPSGTYQDFNKCTACNAVCKTCLDGNSCETCSSPFFFDGSGQCVTICPSGQFGNSSSNQCEACVSPCATCQSSSVNCTSCISPLLILYQNQCLSNCPSQYFNVSGMCQTCQNCVNCLSADKCESCITGYYLYAHKCYLSCPNMAPIKNDTNQTCTTCDSTCQSCVGTTTNCTTCSSGLYLFNSGCLSICPSGYISNPTTFACQTRQSSSGIFYFPTIFSSFAVFLILLYSKYAFKQTEFITTLTALLSLLVFVSWIIFLISLLVIDSTMDKHIATIFIIITLVVIGLSIFISAIYQVYVCRAYYDDQGFTSWICLDSINRTIHKIVIAGSLLTFVFYRFLYGRLFHRVYFSLNYVKGEKLLSQTHRLALLSILVLYFPIIGITFYTVYSKQSFDQITYCALDALILNVIMIVLLLIQGSKGGAQFFGEVAKKPSSLYQTKGKYVQVEVDSSIISVADFDQQIVKNTKRVRTQVGDKEKDDFFRKITCIDNLNRFGHLNQFVPKEQERPRSLPQTKQLLHQPQFNLNGDEQIQVVHDLFFVDDKSDIYKAQKSDMIEEKHHNVFQQEEKDQNNISYQASIKEQEIIQAFQKKLETQILEREQEVQLFPQQTSQVNLITLDQKFQQSREQKLHESEELISMKGFKQNMNPQSNLICSVPTLSRLKKQEEQRLQKERLQRMLEDQLQQEKLQCVDIVAIQKAENKNPQKKSSLDLLSKFKTVNEKPIDEKAARKLQSLAKKNGIDPEFMEQTFGIQKHHNQQLLNEIIDIHNHVNRDAVREMFKQGNNREVLQQLFSKNSNLDSEKLKEIMNDENGLQMIKRLMDEEKGIVSPNIATKLLQKNSKFKSSFTKTLLGGQSGADDTKLQKLLRYSETEKIKEQNLNSLKKVGGESLQNIETIKGMLGKESNLDTDQFSKVAQSLSPRALQSIFHNNNPEKSEVINKILNNKKLDLEPLTPIFENDELIYEIGQKLGGNNPILQQNINYLLKNCGENVDPQKLMAFLQNQVLVKKLMQNSVIDPQFLIEVLSKESKVSLELLQKTLNEMSEEDIQKIFEFTGEKNLDYKAISKIFEQNMRTDPELVKKMLDPDLVSQIFSKGNKVNQNMLQKLVEKGSKFDKDNIVNVYGKNLDNLPSNRNNVIENEGVSTRRKEDINSLSQGEKDKIGKSKSTFQISKNRNDSQILRNESVPEMMKNKNFILEQQQIQLNDKENRNIIDNDTSPNEFDFQMTFNKTANDNFALSEKGQGDSPHGNEMIMSRTDGGMMGFLNPLKLKQNKANTKAIINKKEDWDDLEQKIEDISQDSDEEQIYRTVNNDPIMEEQEDDGEVTGRKRRKIPLKKKKLKKVTDIRHPAQKIYLEPILAPHQVQNRNLRKKKKNQSLSGVKLIMDEDNDVFDIDF